MARKGRGIFMVYVDIDAQGAQWRNAACTTARLLLRLG
jgi:hypothetical protein